MLRDLEQQYKIINLDEFIELFSKYEKKIDKEQIFGYNLIEWYNGNFKNEIEKLARKKVPNYLIPTIKPPELKPLEMTPEESKAVIRPEKKKPWSLKRTKDYYSGKVYNLYRDAVEQKYTSREEASKEIEENVAKIHSATQPEDVKTWYETQFLPLVKHLDIRNKYMKEPEPIEIKQLELTPEEEEQMKGTVLFPASTEFESPIKSEARSVVNRISQQRVRQLRNEIELKNIEQYRSMRREDLVAFCRGIDNEEDKKIMKLSSDNQVDRVKIIKEQEKSYQRILKEKYKNYTCIDVRKNRSEQIF